MSGDCISRSALQKSYHEECIGDCYVCKRYLIIKDSENKGISHCLLIDNAPTVEPERPQGEWEIITFPHSLNKYKCNQCQHYLYAGMDRNFCPNCGAKMRKGGTE